jgi:hypothetical protein
VTAPLTDPMGLLLAAARVDPVLMRAARQVDEEVQAFRALRPDCPTCEGTETVGCHVCGNRTDGYTCGPEACPDCTDGKMPLDKWVALLVETLAAARSDMEVWAAYASDYFTAKHNLAGDLASVDAVLKMVPKVAE